MYARKSTGIKRHAIFLYTASLITDELAIAKNYFDPFNKIRQAIDNYGTARNM
jgi:hypothetical protein